MKTFDERLDEAIGNLLEDTILDESIIASIDMLAEDSERGMALKKMVLDVIKQQRADPTPITVLDVKMLLKKYYPEGVNDEEVIDAVLTALSAHGVKIVK